jgi:hypothetical protein
MLQKYVFLMQNEILKMGFDFKIAKSRFFSFKI